MMWPLICLNGSIATLNAILQLLNIYIFGASLSNYDFCVMGLLMILLNLMEASYNVGDDIEWVNFIYWSLCLVN